MYREMRRKDRRIEQKEAERILEKGEYGFLATVDEDKMPYVVPISYVVINDEIFFHSAHTGKKMDNILSEPQVCFSVVGDTKPVYAKNFTTYFESVIVYGKIRIIEDPEEKRRALFMLAEKYLPDFMDNAPGDIEGSLAATNVMALKIMHMTGKAKREKQKTTERNLTE